MPLYGHVDICSKDQQEDRRHRNINQADKKIRPHEFNSRNKEVLPPSNLNYLYKH